MNNGFEANYRKQPQRDGCSGNREENHHAEKHSDCIDVLAEETLFHVGGFCWRTVGEQVLTGILQGIEEEENGGLE